jgi:hypothetical protein
MIDYGKHSCAVYLFSKNIRFYPKYLTGKKNTLIVYFGIARVLFCQIIFGKYIDE